MPCKKCKDGKYKYGNTGECKYDTKEECEKANPKKYNKMKQEPSPLGKKTYAEYEKEVKNYKQLEELKLSKVHKVKLSRIDDIEEVIFRGLGLLEFVEEDLDQAFEKFIRAKDTVRFDMNDAYTEGESMLEEFKDEIKELGLDIPASVKDLEKDLARLSDEIDEAEQRIKDF